MTLEAKLKVIREKLKDNKNFPNESSISQGIVLPILRELNWDTDDTKVVRPEHSVVKGRADFALCGDGGNPKVIIEVKKLGSGTEDAEEQGLKYARRTHSPAPIVVSTDGGTWSFCLLEQGGDSGYAVKRVDEIDVLINTPQESSEVLQRYLERDRVVEGEALKTARVNFFLKMHLKGNPAEPIVDKTIVNKKINDFVVAIYALRVNARQFEIGIKSAEDNTDHDIADYFHSLLREKFSQSPIGTTAQRTQHESEERVPTQPLLGTSDRKQPIHRRVRQVSASPPSGASGGGRGGELVISGKKFPFENKSGVDAMVTVLQELQKRKSDLYELIYESDWNWGKTRTRRRIAPSPEELYPAHPHLRRYYKAINNNWVVSTNHSRETIEKIIERVTKMAGLKFGRDIIINFDA